MIRLAFAGTGYINQIHAQAALAASEVELCAVVNHQAPSMEKFAKHFNIARQYSTIEDLLSAGNVDALVVGTPNALHAAQTVAALQAGVHVLVEKPMAMNAQEAQQMVDAAATSKAVLMVAHCWRYEPQVRWLHRQLQEGRVGKIVRTKGYSVHVNWGPSGWFTNAALAGGGALADMGIHAIDTTRYLLDDPFPLSVYARVGTHYGNYDVDDTVTLMINWDNGSYSVIESGWSQPHADGTEAATRLYGVEGYAQIFPPFILSGEEMEQPAFSPEANFDEMYQVQMTAFLESIRVGLHSKMNGLNGLINMKIVDAAYESARSGRVVAFESL